MLSGVAPPQRGDAEGFPMEQVMGMSRPRSVVALVIMTMMEAHHAVHVMELEENVFVDYDKLQS